MQVEIAGKHSKINVENKDERAVRESALIKKYFPLCSDYFIKKIANYNIRAFEKRKANPKEEWKIYKYDFLDKHRVNLISLWAIADIDKDPLISYIANESMIRQNKDHLKNNFNLNYNYEKGLVEMKVKIMQEANRGLIREVITKYSDINDSIIKTIEKYRNSQNHA